MVEDGAGYKRNTLSCDGTVNLERKSQLEERGAVGGGMAVTRGGGEVVVLKTRTSGQCVPCGGLTRMATRSKATGKEKSKDTGHFTKDSARNPY